MPAIRGSFYNSIPVVSCQQFGLYEASEICLLIYNDFVGINWGGIYYVMFAMHGIFGKFLMVDFNFLYVLQ